MAQLDRLGARPHTLFGGASKPLGVLALDDFSRRRPLLAKTAAESLDDFLNWRTGSHPALV